jgi:hypothetical protein
LIVKKGSSACAGTNLFTYSGRWLDQYMFI